MVPNKTSKKRQTLESIIDWSGKHENIYKLKNNDLEELGIDFIEVEK